MMDLTGFRPFSLKDFAEHLTPGIYQPMQLIIACQVKHLGFVDGKPVNKGAKALADWIILHADFIAKPKPGGHPLHSGCAIERILAGDILPEEDFAVALAEMTEGTVLPEMFGLPVPLTEMIAPDFSPRAGAVEKAPEHGVTTPAPASAPSQTADLPALGALGGALPPGQLFHTINDTRFAEGFVLNGCGLALCLNESTAVAMRAALDSGIDFIRRQRSAGEFWNRVDAPRTEGLAA